MKNFIKSKYFTYILAATFSIAFVAFFIFNPSHAYFQVHKDFIGVNTAKVDLLFDKFDVNDQTAVDTKEYGDLTVLKAQVDGAASLGAKNILVIPKTCIIVCGTGYKNFFTAIGQHLKLFNEILMTYKISVIDKISCNNNIFTFLVL